MHLKLSSAKRRPFCLNLNVLGVNPLRALLSVQGSHRWQEPTECVAAGVHSTYQELWWSIFQISALKTKDCHMMTSSNGGAHHTYQELWSILQISALKSKDCHMMTSSNGNTFPITGPLCREFTGHRWIPCTKASDAELWCCPDLRLNKRLSKQSRRRWFEMPSHSLWHHCNESVWWLCDHWCHR